MAIIGLAAGTSAKQATAAFGPIPIDGFEIDREILRVGETYFDLTDPNLNPIAQDGRWGLAHSGEKYTLISIDAYRPPYIPWHLTTREFFGEIHSHLDSNGSLVLNVGRVPEDDKLLSGLVATIQTVFTSVHVMDVPGTYNSMIYATVQPTNWEYLEENYISLAADDDTHPLLIESIRIALESKRPLPSGGMVFTDDKAPIERITNQMVLSNIFSDPALLGEGNQ